MVCEAGHQESQSGQNCEPCPLNSYKSTADTTCIPCGTDADGNARMTMQMGSTSVDDCSGKCLTGTVTLRLCVKRAHQYLSQS